MLYPKRGFVETDRLAGDGFQRLIPQSAAELCRSGANSLVNQRLSETDSGPAPLIIVSANSEHAHQIYRVQRKDDRY